MKPKRKRRQPERAVQRQIMALLDAARVPYYSLSQPRATMQTPGLPDLLAFPRRVKMLACGFRDVTCGATLAIECKAPKGHRTKVSPAQRVFAARWIASGNRHVYARDTSDVKAILAELGIMKRDSAGIYWLIPEAVKAQG